jgi:hypothetical protein
MNPENPSFSPEGEQATLDISERVAEMLRVGGPRAAVDLRTYINSLSDRPHLTLTLDYSDLNRAKWVKAFLNNAPPEQQRTAAIRATEAQMKEAANVFASGVEWIPKEN